MQIMQIIQKVFGRSWMSDSKFECEYVRLGRNGAISDTDSILDASTVSRSGL